MEGTSTIDFVQVLTGASPSLGLGLLCLYWLRSVYNDALRREAEYAESLKILYANLFEAQQVWASKLTKMETDLAAARNESIPAIRQEIHALKNTIQTFVLERAAQSQSNRARTND